MRSTRKIYRVVHIVVREGGRGKYRFEMERRLTSDQDAFTSCRTQNRAISAIAKDRLALEERESKSLSPNSQMQMMRC